MTSSMLAKWDGSLYQGNHPFLGLVVPKKNPLSIFELLDYIIEHDNHNYTCDTSKLCDGTNYHLYTFYPYFTIEISYISVIQYHFGLHGDCSQKDMLQNVETRERMLSK